MGRSRWGRVESDPAARRRRPDPRPFAKSLGHQDAQPYEKRRHRHLSDRERCLALRRSQRPQNDGVSKLDTNPQSITGRGVMCDYGEAVRWSRQPAEQGFEPAANQPLDCLQYRARRSERQQRGNEVVSLGRTREEDRNSAHSDGTFGTDFTTRSARVFWLFSDPEKHLIVYFAKSL